MGSSISVNNIVDTSLLQDSHSKNENLYYSNKYNLIPSFPNIKYNIINTNSIKNILNNYIESNSNYIDLRTNFPDIININNLPFNPIASVVYCLQYCLLTLNLPLFPPSQMYIYRHCFFYKNIPNLLSFEIIFNSIKNYGICSENDFKTNINNLNSSICETLYDKASKYKFIKVYKVEQTLSILRNILRNKIPILIGMTVNYKLENISDKLWIPSDDENLILGGLSGVLVGFIEEREVFIMAQTFGSEFGISGYITVPYKYIINPKFVFELYTISFDRIRVEGCLNSSKKVINLQTEIIKNDKSLLGSLFN